MFWQFLSAGMEYQYAGISHSGMLPVSAYLGSQLWEMPLRTQNIRDIHRVMKGELREEIFACRRARGRALWQEKQGTVTGEGKI